VIRVESLGKLYRIGPRKIHTTLRDTIAINFDNFTQRRYKKSHNLEGADAEHIWALKDVSFEVKKGEVVGIIGRNGAGKSTLLKILSRITPPTEGYVHLYGRVGSLLEVGTGFQSELTGRENIYLNGIFLGMKKSEIGRKFDEIVAFSEIERFIDTPIKHYSSGMYVRLAFAVAAHLEPEILIVDEVLAVGDTAFQKKCLERVEAMAKEGRTVLLVSHNMASILQLSSNVMLLDRGRVVKFGEKRSVVSAYLSNNNVVTGEAELDDSNARGKAKFTKIYVRDEAGEASKDIAYENPFYIVVEYEVRAKVDRLFVGLMVSNIENVAVFHTDAYDMTDGRYGIQGEIGHHRASVRIPGALLSPGKYYVSEIGLWSPDFIHHHLLTGSLMSFEITSSHIKPSGSLVLRPKWEWFSE